MNTRREFLQTSMLTGSALFQFPAGHPRQQRMVIATKGGRGLSLRLAERELMRGLVRLKLPAEAGWTENDQPAPGELLFQLSVRPEDFRGKEEYSIARLGNRVELKGASDAAAVYAVFDFLERQGAYFGLDGEAYPPDPATALVLPHENERWAGSPRLGVRGLLPWPDFLNCITVYNDEDFRAYFEAMLRMRFNTFGMHVYSSPESSFMGTESYLSFEFAGAGHHGFLDNSASGRWGYLPQRTSTFGMGAGEYFSGEVFGSDATVRSANTWEIADRTRAMLRKALNYARTLGIACGIGFEPYQIPGETARALPPAIKPKEGKRFPGGAAFDVESNIARKLLETRLGQLLEAYPDVDYVWLWEDETMNWESRKTGVPLSITPFQQAYNFLRRHAPQKKMVLSGWGGVVRHFEYFHQKLPMDVVFSCLNDSLGWDPVHEVFGKLEGRERWPIPWLEDDPSMWLPQYHVNRTDRDVRLAERYGCQGMLGIHWRNRAIDATAGFFARSCWDKNLTPSTHFAQYARTQALSRTAPRLGNILQEADSKQSMLNAGTELRENDHMVTRQWTPDYDEGFVYREKYEPDEQTVRAQKRLAVDLRKIAGECSGSAAEEKTDYLAGFVEFAIPYGDSWTAAHRIGQVLEEAATLKAAGKTDEARHKVVERAVPLFLRMAPLVRETMLKYQSIVSNRSDLGQLASMQNKYVRLALHRLPLEMEEYLEELPANVRMAVSDALAPAPDGGARLFVPTRPGVLQHGEIFRIFIVVTGSQIVEQVLLQTRALGRGKWSHSAAKPVGRRTYEAYVEPMPGEMRLMEYYVSASVGKRRLTSPIGGADNPHLVTLI